MLSYIYSIDRKLCHGIYSTIYRKRCMVSNVIAREIDGRQRGLQRWLVKYYLDRHLNTVTERLESVKWLTQQIIKEIREIQYFLHIRIYYKVLLICRRIHIKWQYRVHTKSDSYSVLNWSKKIYSCNMERQSWMKWRFIYFFGTSYSAKVNHHPSIFSLIS